MKEEIIRLRQVVPLPSEEEVHETLGKLAGYVRDIGDRITHAHAEGVLKGTPNEEIGPLEFRGHRCISNDEVYYIAAHPEVRYVTVVYYLSFTENVARELSHEHAEAILEEAELDVHGSDPRMLAATYLLQSIDQAEVQSFKSYFRIAVGGENYLTTLNTSESGALEGYSLQHLIFPYEDSFSIKEFNDAVTTIVSSGMRSAEIVRRNLHLLSEDEDPAKTKVVLRE